MLSPSADLAVVSFFTLGSFALVAHLVSILKSYLKIREMRAKAKDKAKKLAAPLYVSKKKLAIAKRHTVNRPRE